MKRRVIAMIMCAVFVLLVLGGGVPRFPAQSAEKWKVAFLQVGPVGDAGWTYQSDLARRELEKRLDWVETMQVENVGPSDSRRVIEDFIKQGAKVIMVQDPTIMDMVLDIASEHRDRYFLVANAFKYAPNVGGFYGHMEQAYYLCGLVAGKMAKSHVVGFVGSFPVPTIIQAINGFALGVKAANPNAKVRLVWTQNWYSPPQEKQAAQSLLNVGADVLAQYVDSPTTIQTAAAAGKWAIGSDSDTSRFAPDAYLTGQIWYWTDLYERLLKSLRDGTWKPVTVWGNLADGTVRLGPLNKAIPASVRQQVADAKAAIVSGRLKIFTGPLSDNTGKQQVPAGKSLGEQETHGMNWLVSNVVGSLPK
ncbi:MAG: BMP family ABC transporter substrate-binding protein [Bacillati bacterium ANGP1]|uniref:BMP family ABC transporter substrate-binding protein n=1 Tax=Candidatus Segetimicrobium genomatis TaxID=2569760 RepID=A0A537JZ30_9BACT|nr:MAG: BMP family ABC transporter substrate-binding protein [Terrabacteria group bacterium ANGP1]